MPMIKTTAPKKVLVAGAGVAGLECARVLAERGHKVLVCEATDTLGGNFNLASKAPMKEAFATAVEQMIRWAKEAGVEFKLNTPVTEAVIAAEKPDYVVNAIGAHYAPCTIPGAENAVSATDVLSGKVQLKGNVVVIGGGCVGMETAMFAAVQPGVTSVTGVDKKAGFGTFDQTPGWAPKLKGGVPSYGRAQGFRLWNAGNTAIHNEPHGIKTMGSTTAEAIAPGKATVHTFIQRRNRQTKEMEVVKDETIDLPADVIVYATGMAQNDGSAIAAACEKLGVPCTAIGSAKQLGHGVPAIMDGAVLGREI